MDLGQVFTRQEIADYMVSLFNIDTNENVLDPCFGEGVFIKSLLANQFKLIQGYEIDSRLFEHTKQQRFESVELFNTDFLLSKNNKKYGGIIMNPPYIRHEKINDLDKFGITKERLLNEKIYRDLPPNANIYMYFVIKAISLLKNNGELIIIFPNNWIQSKHGIAFKDLILKECIISEQVSISGQLFEKKALVEVFILKLVKTQKPFETTIKNLIFTDGKLVKDSADGRDLDIVFPYHFSKLADIRRGLTTGHNKMYVNPTLNDDNYEQYIIPIVSSPKAVKGYSTRSAFLDKILILDKSNHSDMPQNLRSYLNAQKQQILADKKPKTLFEKIKSNENNWFEIKKIPSEGIIFSYFVRDDIRFIMNDGDYLIRDNFYIICPKIDKYLMFALLNNYYSYYQLEKIGKEYGGGLLKLQKYDLENIKFPNTTFISQEDNETLKQLAKKLLKAKSNYQKLIDDITKIISHYSDINYDLIKSNYLEKKRSRLEK